MAVQYDMPNGNRAEEPVFTIGDAENGDLVGITRGVIQGTRQNQKGELIFRIQVEPGCEDYIWELGRNPGHTYNIFFRRIRGRVNRRYDPDVRYEGEADGEHRGVTPTYE